MYVTSIEIIKKASEEWYAVPAFAAEDIQTVEKIVETGNMKKSPLIVIAAPAVCAKARKVADCAEVPVALYSKRCQEPVMSKRAEALALDISPDQFHQNANDCLDTIFNLRRRTGAPLALDGGSEIPELSLKKAICLGVAEISFQIDETMEDDTEIINFCTDKMAVCGSCGKA